MRGSPQVCRHRTQGGGHLPGERLQGGGYEGSGPGARGPASLHVHLKPEVEGSAACSSRKLGSAKPLMPFGYL